MMISGAMHFAEDVAVYTRTKQNAQNNLAKIILYAINANTKLHALETRQMKGWAGIRDLPVIIGTIIMPALLLL